MSEERKSTVLTISVSDGMKPFLVQVAAKEDREGLWNLSSILLPQIGVEIKANPGATGTMIAGDTLAAIADGQRDFLDRMDERRRAWRTKKDKGKRGKNPRESPGIPENPGESQNFPPSYSHTYSHTNASPQATPQEAGASAPDFAAFWDAYPKKVGRQAAIKAFASLASQRVITAEALPAILSALERQKRTRDWTKDGGRFVPHPATWLNGRRWEDVLKPDAPGRPAGPATVALPPDEEDAL